MTPRTQFHDDEEFVLTYLTVDRSAEGEKDIWRIISNEKDVAIRQSLSLIHLHPSL